MFRATARRPSGNDEAALAARGVDPRQARDFEVAEGNPGSDTAFLTAPGFEYKPANQGNPEAGETASSHHLQHPEGDQYHAGTLLTRVGPMRGGAPESRTSPEGLRAIPCRHRVEAQASG